jgi:transcription initiation factor TFIIH subunit 1
MLKVFTQPPGASEPEIHVFTFTSTLQARAEADAIKEALSKAIQLSKNGGTMASVPEGTLAAMGIGGDVSSKPGGDGTGASWYSDELLKTDDRLHKSLLKADASLSRTFVESLRTKPGSISSSQFTAQFWATRLHLLRAHAIETSQTKGAYNVLSAMKPKSDQKLSLSREQVQLIFSQHSLVKRVYDETVPKISETDFWSRFFSSRLFKKLKGEKVSDSDPVDVVLDKYLTLSDDVGRNQRLQTSHVPRFIDLAGNEENYSQRQGNAPDKTMRPAAPEQVPIFRTLNSLSEKIMAHVASNDVDPSEPIGMDEEAFNQLALRDLQNDTAQNRIILNIKDQGHFFSTDEESDISMDTRRYGKQDPCQVLSALTADLKIGSNLPLGEAIGVNDESSDSENEGTLPWKSHVGSKASLSGASGQIFSAIAQQRAQNDDLSIAGFTTLETASTCDLPTFIFERLTLTHATTTEFLHHFWLAFLSGDPARAEEIAKLVETLSRAMDRAKVVADDAEVERMKEVGRAREQVREHYARTHKKLAFNPDAIRGGSKVVNQLMAPTVEAIRIATSKYRQALNEEA